MIKVIEPTKLIALIDLVDLIDLIALIETIKLNEPIELIGVTVKQYAAQQTQ